MNLPKLYNPKAAAIWSLFLPCFLGPAVHGLNWSQLGEKTKARNAWIWAAVFVIFSLSFPGFLLLILFPIWYYASGQHQVSLWKSMPETEYEKKQLTKPLLLALLFFAVYTGVMLAISQPVPETRHDVLGPVSFSADSRP